MRTFWHLLLVVGFVASSTVLAQEPKPAEGGVRSDPAVSVPAFPNVNCPIMGKPASNKLFVDTEYGRIYVCCVACNKKIRQDPQGTYKTAYPATVKAANTICPVTGDKIEPGSPAITIQGKEINLCCQECVKPAKANAQTTLVKVLNPKANVVGNSTCPITGEPVNPNVVVLIGDDLVHLSSTKCVEEVQKAPRATLEKAKSLAVKAPAKDDKGKDEHDGHDHRQRKG